jgi:hypothetical protein
MEMLRETFFVQGLIVSVLAAVLVKIIVWRNYHKLLVSSEEMDRPKRYWIGTLKKKIENYYSLHAKVNNISCIVDKYLEANKIMGINSFFLEQIPVCWIRLSWCGQRNSYEFGYQFLGKTVDRWNHVWNCSVSV